MAPSTIVIDFAWSEDTKPGSTQERWSLEMTGFNSTTGKIMPFSSISASFDLSRDHRYHYLLLLIKMEKEKGVHFVVV